MSAPEPRMPTSKVLGGAVVFVMATGSALAFAVMQPDVLELELERQRQACAVPEEKRTPEQARGCNPEPAPLGQLIPGTH